MRPITTSIKLKPEDLVFQCDSRELLEFMVAMDLQMSDTDFSMKLIRELVSSLANDMEPRELTQFLRLCDPAQRQRMLDADEACSIESGAGNIPDPGDSTPST